MVLPTAQSLLQVGPAAQSLPPKNCGEQGYQGGAVKGRVLRRQGLQTGLMLLQEATLTLFYSAQGVLKHWKRVE